VEPRNQVRTISMSRRPTPETRLHKRPLRFDNAPPPLIAADGERQIGASNRAGRRIRRHHHQRDSLQVYAISAS